MSEWYGKDRNYEWSRSYDPCWFRNT